MPTFICSLRWTDKGVQFPAEIPTRRNLARGEVAREFKVDVKQIFYTSVKTISSLFWMLPMERQLLNGRSSLARGGTFAPGPNELSLTPNMTKY